MSERVRVEMSPHSVITHKCRCLARVWLSGALCGVLLLTFARIPAFNYLIWGAIMREI